MGTSVHRDLEARLREAERRAFEAEAAYETLLGQVPGAIYSYAAEIGTPTLCMSAYIEELLGVPAERFLAGDAVWDELLHPDDRERAWADYESFIRTGEPDCGDYRYIRPDGRVVWLQDRSAMIRDRDGSPLLVQGVIFDITATKETALRMEHMAYHDILTGLPNRAMFQDHLELALARARRHELSVAVLFLDLDDFKSINDTHGHEVGDELLQQAARRIRSATRDADLVARQGGMSSWCSSPTSMSGRATKQRRSSRRQAIGSLDPSPNPSGCVSGCCRSAGASAGRSSRSRLVTLVRSFGKPMRICTTASANGSIAPPASAGSADRIGSARPVCLSSVEGAPHLVGLCFPEPYA
jgi:diguanylate cyclase (GGDEF)-like protein/PAS domain S-box-containing protein